MKLFLSFAGLLASLTWVQSTTSPQTLIQPTETVANENSTSAEVIHEAVSEAKDQVNRAFLAGRTKAKTVMESTPTPLQLSKIFKQATGQTREVLRKAQVWEECIKILGQKEHMNLVTSNNVTVPSLDLVMLSREVGCNAVNRPVKCDWNSTYRTITGECNNRKDPTLGSSNRALARWLPAEYEDGISQPYGWTPGEKKNGFYLPLVRDVSNKIASYLNEDDEFDPSWSLVLMQWGQWVDHDLDFAPDTELMVSEYTKEQCDEHCIQEDNCFPIMFPPGDPKLNKQGLCMPFFRAGFVCPTHPFNSLTREQINALTSFLDASMVYGPEPLLANKLRNTSSPLGLMAVNEEFSDNGLAFPPFDNKQPSPCKFINATAGVPCFLAGDSRANEHALLAIFHTLFLREHNRLATELKRLNPHWDGEKIYQETRKIVGAITQVITFEHYLPLVLGEELEKQIPEYQGYNESVDPRIANVFTLAFRFGHAEVPSTIHRLDEHYEPWGSEPELRLNTLFFNTWRVVKDGGIDPFVRGMLAKPSKMLKQNKIMSSELRDKLFQPTQKIHGFDLASINMQRGRDHGLPGYNSWRRFCGLSQPKTTEELSVVLGNNENLAKKFMDLYGTPENIDLWIGAIAEPLVPGGRVGPLLACLLGKQFRKIRDGDRFFWKKPGVFTPQQQAALKKVSFPLVVCDNTHITEVPINAFKANRYPRDFVKCSDIEKLDLSPWVSMRD
ncbi:lactoperoxidase [Dromiciops gliroides]|uniref:lactoperoxidase n=1 Tax=Dromiciops gliroides TaxID=33562 RepID=UPI001CC3BDEE|nr:lactoperoxidase [Dromiciops gliroides]